MSDAAFERLLKKRAFQLYKKHITGRGYAWSIGCSMPDDVQRAVIEGMREMYELGRQSGISSLDRRPDEQNAVQLSAQTAEPVGTVIFTARPDGTIIFTPEQLENYRARIITEVVEKYAQTEQPSLSDERIDLFAIFEAGWGFFAALKGHVLDGRDVGRLTGCEFWPPALRDMHVGTDLHVGLTVDEATVRVKQEVKRRLDRLSAQRQDSDKDAEILNWLEANPGFELQKFITWINGADEYDGVERKYWQVTTNDDVEYKGSTLREAITAAIANGSVMAKDR